MRVRQHLVQKKFHLNATGAATVPLCNIASRVWCPLPGKSSRLRIETSRVLLAVVLLELEGLLAGASPSASNDEVASSRAVTSASWLCVASASSSASSSNVCLRRPLSRAYAVCVAPLEATDGWVTRAGPGRAASPSPCAPARPRYLRHATCRCCCSVLYCVHSLAKTSIVCVAHLLNKSMLAHGMLPYFTVNLDHMLYVIAVMYFFLNCTRTPAAICEVLFSCLVTHRNQTRVTHLFRPCDPSPVPQASFPVPAPEVMLLVGMCRRCHWCIFRRTEGARAYSAGDFVVASCNRLQCSFSTQKRSSAPSMELYRALKKCALYNTSADPSSPPHLVTCRRFCATSIRRSPSTAPSIRRSPRNVHARSPLPCAHKSSSL